MYQRAASGYDMYKKNQVETASKKNLVVMLYDGAIKFLKFSLIAMDDKNIEKTNEYLLRTQDIISELMITLNFDAGEIANNLYNLYEYMNHELVQANIKKDRSKVENIKSMLEELRGAWSQIIK